MRGRPLSFFRVITEFSPPPDDFLSHVLRLLATRNFWFANSDEEAVDIFLGTFNEVTKDSVKKQRNRSKGYDAEVWVCVFLASI